MKYLVRLEPLTPFFFGGSKTFSSYNGHSQLQYIAKSTLFPQQTHLLGMTRRTLLEKEGLLSLGKNGWQLSEQDEDKAFQLVGGIQGGSEETLGKIKMLSPVFLLSVVDNGVSDFHFTLPKDTGLCLDKQSYAGSRVCLSGTKNREALCFEKFKAKTGVKKGMTTSAFWEAYKDGKEFDGANALSIEKMYKEVWQIGIKRTNRTVNEDDDGSLYKKCSYSFTSKKNQFGFILELKDDLFGEAYSRQVNLGAERSLFQLVVEKFKDEYKTLYPVFHGNGLTRAVVLGDLFTGPELFSSSRFILNEGFQPFGRLAPVQHSGSKNYHTKRTEQNNLLPKGSVIFFPEEQNKRERLKKILEEGNKFYSAIGYNQLLFV